MPYDGLRQFIKKLGEENDLLEIDEELLPEPDVGAITNATCNIDGPALLMKNVKGYKISLATAIHASNRRLAIALGLANGATVKEIFHEFNRRVDGYPVMPKKVGSAPCKEVIRKGRDINLINFPIVRWNIEDGGPYIDKGLVISRNPETGVINIGMYRLQLKGPRELGIWPGLAHGIGIHFRQSVSAGKPLQVAIAIGNDPCLTLAATSSIPESWDEYAFAGCLRGAPVRVIDGESVSLPVPAHSEVILEGVIEPDKRDIEGCFGEFTGYYTHVFKNPVIRLTAITHKREPIWEGLHIGRPWTENDYLLHIPTSVMVYRQVKAVMPEIQAFNLASCWTLTGIASMKQSYGGQAKQLMNAIWATNRGTYMKNLFVVDDDIDPFDLDQVLYALSTRFQGDDDFVSIRNAAGTMLDPSAPIRGLTTKVGFDLTWPKPPEMVPQTPGMVEPRPETKLWEKYIQGKLKGEAAGERPPISKGVHIFQDGCPRCSNKKFMRIGRSPKGTWLLFKCPRCSYVWRSGEGAEMMATKSKLSEDDLKEIRFFPPLDM